MKAYENKYANFTMQVYNAVFTAEYNINRKKGRKALNPMRKIPQKADIEELNIVVNTLKEVTKKHGEGWTKRILDVNGIKKGGI